MMQFSALPEWVCFILTFIFVLVSHEIGFKIGLYRRNRPGSNPETAAGALSGTTVGLLAFMLAFTFNGAATDYSKRKDLIIDEANAVRTAYQRSMGLQETDQAKVRGLLQEYLDIRIGLLKSAPADLRKILAPAIERNSAIQEELWSTAVERPYQHAAMASLFMTSLNEMFDLHVKRLSAFLDNRITSMGWGILFFLLFVTMAMLGYRIGLDGERSVFIHVGWALGFSAVVFLIIALDRPIGMMTINHQPLLDVRMLLR